MEAKTKGIVCKAPLFLKLFPLGLWILAATWFNTPHPAQVVFWIFWIYMGTVLLVATQDFVLFEEGIEVRILLLRIRTFVDWENVQSAYHDTWKTRIYIKNVTPPNRFIATLVNTGFGITSWYTNYDLAVQILEERLGKRFFGTRTKKKNS